MHWIQKGYSIGQFFLVLKNAILNTGTQCYWRRKSLECLFNLILSPDFY